MGDEYDGTVRCIGTERSLVCSVLDSVRVVNQGSEPEIVPLCFDVLAIDRKRFNFDN